VIRIAITAEAFEAIKGTLPLGSAAYEPQRTAQGGYFIWVEHGWLNKLEALRQPGEGLSETIIRLVAMEAGGRPGRRAAELFWGEDPPCASRSLPRSAEPQPLRDRLATLRDTECFLPLPLGEDRSFGGSSHVFLHKGKLAVIDAPNEFPCLRDDRLVHFVCCL
jgi:hypothetical protein